MTETNNKKGNNRRVLLYAILVGVLITLIGYQYYSQKAERIVKNKKNNLMSVVDSLKWALKDSSLIQKASKNEFIELSQKLVRNKDQISVSNNISLLLKVEESLKNDIAHIEEISKRAILVESDNVTSKKDSADKSKTTNAKGTEVVTEDNKSVSKKLNFTGELSIPGLPSIHSLISKNLRICLGKECSSINENLKFNLNMLEKDNPVPVIVAYKNIVLIEQFVDFQGSSEKFLNTPITLDPEQNTEIVAFWFDASVETLKEKLMKSNTSVTEEAFRDQAAKEYKNFTYLKENTYKNKPNQLYASAQSKLKNLEFKLSGKIN